MVLEQYSDEIEAYAPSIGRVLIGAFFLFQGVTKVTGGFSGFAGFVGSLGLPAPTAVAGLVVAIEALGGLALLLGIRARLVGLGLAAYLLLVNLVAHQFWTQADQLPTFMKNLAIMGGLLLQSALGSGDYSLEEYLE